VRKHLRKILDSLLTQNYPIAASPSTQQPYNYNSAWKIRTAIKPEHRIEARRNKYNPWPYLSKKAKCLKHPNHLSKQAGKKENRCSRSSFLLPAALCRQAVGALMIHMKRIDSCFSLLCSWISLRGWIRTLEATVTYSSLPYSSFLWCATASFSLWKVSPIAFIFLGESKASGSCWPM